MPVRKVTRDSSPLTVPAAPRATVDALHGADLRETTRSLEGTGGASSAVVMTLSDTCSSRSALSQSSTSCPSWQPRGRTTRMLDEQCSRSTGIGRGLSSASAVFCASDRQRVGLSITLLPRVLDNHNGRSGTPTLARTGCDPLARRHSVRAHADRENRMTTRENERAAALRAFSRGAVHGDSSDPTAHLAASR